MCYVYLCIAVQVNELPSTAASLAIGTPSTAPVTRVDDSMDHEANNMRLSSDQPPTLTGTNKTMLIACDYESSILYRLYCLVNGRWSH